MPQEIIHARTALMPLYYKNFHCLAGACRDSCCVGWKIEFNKKDYLAIKSRVNESDDEALKALCGKSIARLRTGEHDKLYAEFPMNESNRCGFLREDGLCALQLKCGEDALPSICRTFPRLINDTLAAREYVLTPACEGVLALLWDIPEGIDFVEEPLDKKDWLDYEPNTKVTARFADIRSFCIDILQERSLKLSQRLLLMGFLLQQLRDTNWNAEGVVDNWLAQGERLLHNPEVAAQLDRLPRDRQMFIANNYQVATKFLGGVSIQKLVGELSTAVVMNRSGPHISFNELHYRELEGKLEELLDHSEHFFENLMVSVAFQLVFPNLISPEELWKDYANLCSIYSFFSFAAICGCDKEISRERLFHVLVAASRGILHGKNTQNKLQNELFQNDSATLAHMAILVGG